MTREQIEKTALKCAKDRWGDNESQHVTAKAQDTVYGFKQGAQWRINSVWHDANEKPDKNQFVLFECRKTYGKGYSVNFGENYELMKNVIVRWAYIIDLLPERKEETK